MLDLTGEALGRYRLVERLGAGGMAQVYRACDPAGAEVAVKVLYPHLTTDQGFTDRFRREAEAAASLNHPHIIHVLDHGATGELHYLVMELVGGPTLQSFFRNRDRPLTPDEAGSLIGPLADALHYAHEQGVVHRDVKPSNVLLRGGRLENPVLTDFGIARIVDTTVATAAGVVLGTPAYMAPEQGEGQPGDARSDVYALGAMLYELMTGRPPFTADSPYAVILHHINTPPPPPRSLRPELPRPLEAVILRALAKDPATRYPSAAGFAAALARSLRQPAASAPRQRAWRYIAAVTGFLLLVAAFVAWRAGEMPFVSRPASEAVAAKVTPAILVLQGGPAIVDTWLDPDLPDRPAFDDGKIHLQGPSTPDRLLYGVTLPEWPASTELLTATLSLYTVPWSPDNRYATVTAHRMLRDWDLATATYAAPWASAGLTPDVDYQAAPLTVITLTTSLIEEGWLDLDILPATRAWVAGEPNYGLLVRMTDDSFGMAHLWVYASEYEDPDLRPRLTLVYQ